MSELSPTVISLVLPSMQRSKVKSALIMLAGACAPGLCMCAVPSHTHTPRHDGNTARG